MKNKWNAIARIVGLTCIPAMSLFVLMLINYMIFLKTGVIENIYLQVVIMYGIPIILSLCLLPVKLTKYSLKDIGICRNKRWYQDIVLFLGMGILISVFFIKKEMAEMEGAYVIQFLFVGIGEEIFFRSILYKSIKEICNSEIIAVICVAFIFGCLFHMDGGMGALLLVRVPLSVVFSYIYLKTESLSIPIVLHSLYNILV